jgi:hypothetical protein
MANDNIVDAASGLPLPVTAEAASATLPGAMDAGAQAAEAIRALQARLGGMGPAMVPGMQMPQHPIMPREPIKQDAGSAIAQGPFASVGSRKRADTAALFSNISNLVNQANDRLYKQKVEKLQNDFETLSGAITGYNQAKEAGDQRGMEHNANIINSIVLDPKKSKELAKAFQVNLNPMANADGKGKKEKPNPAFDALKGAWAKDQQAYQNKQTMLTPQAQAMMRQMPQTLQANPQYQAYLEAVKAGAIPSAKDTLEFSKNVMEVQQKLNNNIRTNETKLQISKNLAEAMANRTMMQQYGATLRTQMMQFGAKERAQMISDAWKYRADKTLQAQDSRTSVLRERLSGAGGDKDTKQLKLLMDGLDKAKRDLDKNIEEARRTHDTERLKVLNQQADAIAYQQRLVNDRVEKMVGIGSEEPMDRKSLGLSEDEYRLWIDMMQSTNVSSPGDEE